MSRGQAGPRRPLRNRGEENVGIRPAAERGPGADRPQVHRLSLRPPDLLAPESAGDALDRGRVALLHQDRRDGALLGGVPRRIPEQPGRLLLPDPAGHRHVPDAILHRALLLDRRRAADPGQQPPDGGAQQLAHPVRSGDKLGAGLCRRRGPGRLPLCHAATRQGCTRGRQRRLAGVRRHPEPRCPDRQRRDRRRAFRRHPGCARLRHRRGQSGPGDPLSLPGGDHPGTALDRALALQREGPTAVQPGGHGIFIRQFRGAEASLQPWEPPKVPLWPAYRDLHGV